MSLNEMNENEKAMDLKKKAFRSFLQKILECLEENEDDEYVVFVRVSADCPGEETPDVIEIPIWEEPRENRNL